MICLFSILSSYMNKMIEETITAAACSKSGLLYERMFRLMKLKPVFVVRHPCILAATIFVVQQCCD